MNQLLNAYTISVESSEVSGAEQLEMLDFRDQLANRENNLSEEEKYLLTEADQKLLINATKIYSELSRFISLKEYRESHNISPQRWWWYLDVLSYLPHGSVSPVFSKGLDKRTILPSSGTILQL